jgi:Protein of unknown function (DUF3237)
MWSRDGAHELDAATCYSRTNPLFEAGSETYARLNGIATVGTRCRSKGGVGDNIFQVL